MKNRKKNKHVRIVNLADMGTFAGRCRHFAIDGVIVCDNSLDYGSMTNDKLSEIWKAAPRREYRAAAAVELDQRQKDAYDRTHLYGQSIYGGR